MLVKWLTGTDQAADTRLLSLVADHLEHSGPQEHTGMFVSDARALSTHWSQKASEDGAEPAAVRADALRSSACVCPRVLQSVVLLSDSQLHTRGVSPCLDGKQRTPLFS